MKEIAIFTDNLNVGGIQKSVVNLLNNIDYQKYNVDLYLFDNKLFYNVPKKANVIYLKRPSKLFKFVPYRIVKKIYKPMLKNKQYDIAIDFDSYQMHTAIGAVKSNSRKKAIWIHNDIPIKLKEEPKYRILHFFFKTKYKDFDSFCAVSKGALDSFKMIHNNPHKKYYVIPNYIDTNEIKDKLTEKAELTISKDILNIVTVGRLCHQKGIDIMLDNIKKVTKVRQDIHLYIIGDGPLRNDLNNQVNKNNLNNYVTFLGNQKNPFKYLEQMDLFYLSSRYEGQGMVILEAMAVGLDILIPNHLEKYCPDVKGVKDTTDFLINYKKKTSKKKFNDLREYNQKITNELERLFN